MMIDLHDNVHRRSLIPAHTARWSMSARGARGNMEGAGSVGAVGAR